MVGTALCACGAKTGPKPSQSTDQLDNTGGFAEPGDPCRTPSDCVTEDACFPLVCAEDVCVQAPPVDCDDSDPCTEDFCAPQTGQCQHVPLTPDRDEDGHRAPLPGFVAGTSGSCGDDCDDTSDAARPGGVEICDGVDNDCNGVVDDEYAYHRTNMEPVLISTGELAGLGGIAHNGENYGISMTYDAGHKQTQLSAVNSRGEIEYAEDIALTNSDSFAGPLVWTGNSFANVWEDRRDENYEIYFNRFDKDGNKLGPDLRVTNAPDFSLKPALALLGQDYLVAWGDRRGTDFQVYSARVDRDGNLIDPNGVNLTPEVLGAAAASIAVGTTNVGLVFNSEVDDNRIFFRTVSHDLTELGELRQISTESSSGPGVTFADDNYIVTWGLREAFPGTAIWGAVVSSSGDVVVAPRELTVPAPFARSHGLLDMGDRLMLFWAQYDESYDLYFRLITPQLEPLTDAERITYTPGDALGAAPAFGGDGEIGIAFTNTSDGAQKVFFTTLSCE